MDPVKKDIIQLLIQYSNSDLGSDRPSCRAQIRYWISVPRPTGSNEFEVCVSHGQVRRSAVGCGVAKRHAS